MKSRSSCRERLDLPELAALYLGTQVDDQSESAIFQAKRQDLQKFLDFFGTHCGHYPCW